MAAPETRKSPFEGSRETRLKRIAYLGWGSLVWDKQKLKIKGEWQNDGPRMKVEFLRQSERSGNPPKRYLSLVLSSRGSIVQGLWALADHASLESAKTDLWLRETPKERAGKWIYSWRSGEKAPKLVLDLEKWAKEKNIDAVIWTGLPPKWNGTNGSAPSKEEAVSWFKKQITDGEAAFAEEYVRCAPKQIDTEYRRAFVERLGWEAVEKPETVQRVKYAVAGAIAVGILALAVTAISVNKRTVNHVPEHPNATPALVAVTKRPEPQPQSTPVPPPVAQATPERKKLLSLAELTALDTPDEIMLQKNGPFFFKKGTMVTLIDETPLFFIKDFVRIGKKGEQLEVLDYRPEAKRIYCKSQASEGRVIAINFFDVHADRAQAQKIPAESLVHVEKVDGENVIVSLDGFAFILPIADTDLLARASKLRDRREIEAERSEAAERLAKGRMEKAQRLAAEREAAANRTVPNSESGSHFYGWTSISNGRSWNSAPESEKDDLCRRLATVSHKGNSAAFYKDALNALFNTDDPSVLRTSLDGATALIEASSSSLPLNQRNY